MRLLIISVWALALLSAVSSQDFNPQPLLGDYAPLGAAYGPISRPSYDYVGEDSSYYIPPYISGLSPPGPFSNPPSRGGYGTFNDDSLPPSDFPNTPDVFPNSPDVFQNYGVRSSQFIPGSIPRQPVFSGNPQNTLSYPSSEFGNYAPTFNSPPFPGSYNPLPPPALPESSSPNIIRDEEDGKHSSETKTSNTNQTFLSEIPPNISPNFGYGQNPPPSTGVNGRAYPINIPQYYPDANLPPYNSNFRKFGNNFPLGNIQPSVNLTSEFPFDPNQRLGNSDIPNPTGPISPDNFQTQYPEDPKTIFGNNPLSNPPIYPSGDLPDISLSGSPRNLEDPSTFGGFTPPGLQPPIADLPPLPKVSYEAPGHQVPA